MRTPFACLFIGAVLLLPGCVIHQPLSELSSFRDPTVDINPDKRKGFGISATVSSAAARFVETAKLKEFPEPDFWTVRTFNPMLAGGGWYFSHYDPSRKMSVSLTAGVLALGIDMTGKVMRDTYLTLGGSVQGGGQIILQRRLFLNAKAGANLGISGRYTTYSIDARTLDSESVGFGPDDILPVLSVGLRTLLMVRVKRSNGFEGATFGAIFLGYTPRFRAVTLNASIGMGHY